MSIVLANNARSTLSATASSTDTVLYITDTDSFPSLDVDEYFYATIESVIGSYEIVKVTQVNSGSFNVVRAQEGTIAIPFSAGARVEQRITAQTMDDFLLTGNNIDNSAYGPDWNGDTDDAPSRNAVYDKLAAVDTTISGLSSLYQPLDADLTTLGAGGNGARNFLGLGGSDTVAFGALLIGDGGQNITLNSSGLTLSGPLNTDVNLHFKENGTGRWSLGYLASNSDMLRLSNQSVGNILAIDYDDGGIHITATFEMPTINGNEIATLAGGAYTGDISVPDEAYGVGWNGSLEVPTKNAIYDKIESLGLGTGDMLKSENLSGLTNYTTARSNLGLAIGTNVQAYDADTAKTDVAQSWTANQTFGGSDANVLTIYRSGAAAKARWIESTNNNAWGIRNNANTLTFDYNGTDYITFANTGAATFSYDATTKFNRAATPYLLELQTAGTARGYIGASSTYSFILYDSGGTSRVAYHSQTGELALGGASLTFGGVATFTALAGRIAISTETSGTLSAASANKQVNATGDITFNDGVFTAGDRGEIYAGASTRTITQDTGMTLRLDGTATTGNRTLAARGRLSWYALSSTEIIVSGPGVT